MPPQNARLTDAFALAHALHRQGRLADAERLYGDILRADKRNADALHALGLIALQSGQPARGVDLIEKALKLKPRYPEALANLGLGYADLKRPRDALAAYDKALKLNPNLPEVHDNRGCALRDLGRLSEALASHNQALALRPDDAGVHSNRGNVLRDLQRPEEALASYDRALALEPNFIEARCNRAIVLQSLGRREDVLAELDRVVALAPGHAEAHHLRGNVLLELDRAPEALAAQEQSLALNPAYPDAFNSRGNALRALRHDIEALTSYQQAIALSPDYAAALYNTGDTLRALGRAEAALPYLDKAVAVRPEDAAAHRVRALTLSALKRYPQALASFDRAAALAPDTPWLAGDRIAAKRQICDWSQEEAELQDLTQRIEAGETASAPFIVIGWSKSPALQRRCAEVFTATLHPLLAADTPRPPAHDRIRIGYVSADFRDHAMMHVMADLFAAHDRMRFEVIGFSLGPDTGDDWRGRVAAGFDRFIDLRSMADGEAIRFIRAQGIDIAVDLMGFTQGCRPNIFAGRAAPVQVVYLGYPGTLAAPYIDYIIADETLIPAGDERHYAESIVRLPDTYQANTRNHPLGERTFNRADCSLPEHGFVHACFNNPYKISSEMFSVWMRVLQRVPDSVLWLVHDTDEGANNLRREAAARDIAPERLIFAPRLPLADHLRRQALADLFLDTQPYTGHATASLALFSGVPVLTQAGSSFAGRVSASLLRAVGLPELIAASLRDYEDLAVALAQDPARLHGLKSRLAANRDTAPLFDTHRVARHLEAAFEAMHARAQAGLPPAAITVPALRDPGTIRR